CRDPLPPARPSDSPADVCLAGARPASRLSGAEEVPRLLGEEARRAGAFGARLFGTGDHARRSPLHPRPRPDSLDRLAQGWTGGASVPSRLAASTMATPRTSSATTDCRNCRAATASRVYRGASWNRLNVARASMIATSAIFAINVQP